MSSRTSVEATGSCARSRATPTAIGQQYLFTGIAFLLLAGIIAVILCLIGARIARTHPDDITVFKNNGLAVEFVALAAKVYRFALERGRGEEIPANYFSGLRVSSVR